MATKKAASKVNQIMEKKILAPSITLYKLYVPDIARKVKAGQFVVVRGDDMGERIPLTVADYDVKKGTITIIFLARTMSAHPIACRVLPRPGSSASSQRLAIVPKTMPSHW